MYDDFEFAPIVLITAPTSESGKSRLFDVAELVVRSPFLVVDPSGPSIRNVVDSWHPTLMIDEADLLKVNKDMRALLNAGVEKGRLITRAGPRGSILTYDPFGPKMLAGIYGEAPPLRGATLSRCIQIALRRRYDKEEDVADFHKSDALAETALLKAAITQWAQLTSHDALRNARPEMPAELTDRQRDAWRPLIAVADLISGGWGNAARQWAVELSRAVPVTPDIMVQVLRDVYRVLRDYPDHRIKSTVLASLRNDLSDRELDEDINPRQLGMRLKRFHITGTKWYDQSTQVRGFVYKGDSGEWTPEWKDAIGRYRLDEKRDNED